MEAITGEKGGSTTSAAFRGIVAFGVALFLLANVVPSQGIRCYQCGQYTDGVGSITPCINYTEALHLKECPKNKNHCVKYVSEGSTVRDCEAQCKEKDAWGTKIFCCQEDGCNSSGLPSASTILLMLCPAILGMRKLAF